MKKYILITNNITKWLFTILKQKLILKIKNYKINNIQIKNNKKLIIEIKRNLKILFSMIFLIFAT